MNGSGKLIWIGTTLLDILFYYTTYFVFIGWYLFTLKPVLALSIVVVFVPVMLSEWVLMSAFKNLEAASAPIRRESDYYEQCLTDKKSTSQRPGCWGLLHFFRESVYLCPATVERYCTPDAGTQASRSAHTEYSDGYWLRPDRIHAVCVCDEAGDFDWSFCGGAGFDWQSIPVHEQADHRENRLGYGEYRLY
ncbi:hypothetical protein ACFSQ7_14795 [Paenibacillus rhizoplanae]